MKKYYLLVLGLLCSFAGFAQVVIEWEKSFGGSAQDDAYHMDLTSDGGFIVAGRSGSINSDVTNNQGSLDVWLIKLDSNGNLQWQKTYGGSSVDEGHSVMQTVDGGYIIGATTSSDNGDVTGNHGFTDYWVIKTDHIGNLVWQKNYGGAGYDYARDIKQTSNGVFLC